MTTGRTPWRPDDPPRNRHVAADARTLAAALCDAANELENT